MTDEAIIPDANGEGGQSRSGESHACGDEVTPWRPAGSTDTPDWDGELDGEAWSALSWRQKSQRLGASLERKLAIIEAATHDPSWHVAAGLPLNRTRLREWEDRRARLWKWSDRQAERADGPHGALFARFDLAAATLKERVKAASRRPVTEEDKHAVKDRMIEALRRQVAVLISELAKRQPGPEERWR